MDLSRIERGDRVYVAFWGKVVAAPDSPEGDIHVLAPDSYTTLRLPHHMVEAHQAMLDKGDDAVIRDETGVYVVILYDDVSKSYVLRGKEGLRVSPLGFVDRYEAPVEDVPDLSGDPEFAEVDEAPAPEPFPYVTETAAIDDDEVNV